MIIPIFCLYAMDHRKLGTRGLECQILYHVVVFF